MNRLPEVKCALPMPKVKPPKGSSDSKIEALEFALTHVRNYNDRMFLQFLIQVEKRKCGSLL